MIKSIIVLGIMTCLMLLGFRIADKIDKWIGENENGKTSD